MDFLRRYQLNRLVVEEGTVVEERGEGSVGSRDARLLSQIRALEGELEVERRARKALSEELHELMAYVRSSPLGLAPLTAYVGAECYVGSPVPKAEKLERLFNAIVGLAEAVGLKVVDDPDPRSGSVWKRWWLALKYAAAGVNPDDAIKEAVEKTKRALELAKLDGPQADVTAKLVTAGTQVLAAMKDIDGPIAFKLGTILAVQAPDENGKMRRVILELTPEQAKFLTENPSALANPMKILGTLEAPVLAASAATTADSEGQELVLRPSDRPPS